MAEHSAHICLTSDAVSAFMRAQRHEMTRQLYDDESLRPLLPYFFSLYSSHAKIFYGDHFEFSSEEGCHQGCSLGSLLYVLSIAPVIETLIAEFPSVLILGFVDDYYFLGDAVDCAAAYRRYGELLRERGQSSGRSLAKPP